MHVYIFINVFLWPCQSHKCQNYLLLEQIGTTVVLNRLLGQTTTSIRFLKILLLERNKQWKFHRNQLTGNHCVCSVNKTYSCIIHSLTVPLNIFLIFLIIANSKVHTYCIVHFVFNGRVKLVLTQKHVPSVKSTALLGRQATPMARSSCVSKALLSHVADGLKNRVNNSINTRQMKLFLQCA